jgi:type II restriction enzyme
MPKDALRKSHVGITLNNKSAPMEGRMGAAVEALQEHIEARLGLTLIQQGQMNLAEIVAHLTRLYGDSSGLQFELASQAKGTSIRPDGGFLYVQEWGEPKRYVLVAEAKRQGTNTERLAEGKPKQALGNAIERLGKNMRGVDALFAGEDITPFICFGEGCDFAPSSSILDRVATLNGFFPLNRVFVDKVDVGSERLKPVSLFFREESWTPQEMLASMLDVTQRSISYYRAKYDLA